jgi:signal transduction histidine kinase
LELGAVDYITKPFQQDEVIARVKLHLKLHHLSEALQKKNELLKQEIEEKERAEAALKNLTQELEQRVVKRTAELSESLEQLKVAQLKLIQSEKMSALGELIAGIAHEINNPLNFIAGNLRHTEEYVHDLSHHLELYQKHYPNPVPEVQKNAERIDLEFIVEDLNSILGSMKLGTDRIQNITTSLRNFTRTDTNRKVVSNIHEGIDSALLILKHRLKPNERRPEIQVIKEYGHLPEFACYFGPFCQVLINVLANAIDALEDSNQGRSFEDILAKPNRITIQTLLENDQAIIYIKDNGIGIPEEIQEKIFDSLFTTKPVGRGTGLGLAIVRQIIVDQHGGRLDVHSKMGEGSEFTIAVPIQ